MKKLVSPSGFNVTVPDGLEDLFISDGYKQPGEEPKPARAKLVASNAK